MLIDWFTVAAQVVNFLVLVALLRYFLYGRIVRAMEERQAKIAAEFRQAKDREAEAEERAEGLERQRRALEDAKRAELEEARQQAGEERRRLLAEARQEVDARRSAWRMGLEREQEAFLGRLEALAAGEAYAAAEQAVSRLADAELGGRALAVFLRRLEDLPDEQRERLARAAAEDGGALAVVSAGELSADQRRRLTRALHQALGRDLKVAYETEDALGLGLEVRAKGYRLGWSLADYLEGLRSRAERALAAGRSRDGREAA